MSGFEKRLTVRVVYGILDRTLCRCRLEGMIFKLHLNSLFEDGTGPGIEPVGGEFQPSFETVHSGGGAHLIIFLLSSQRGENKKRLPLRIGLKGKRLKIFSNLQFEVQ